MLPHHRHFLVLCAWFLCLLYMYVFCFKSNNNVMEKYQGPFLPLDIYTQKCHLIWEILLYILWLFVLDLCLCGMLPYHWHFLALRAWYLGLYLTSLFYDLYVLKIIFNKSVMEKYHDLFLLLYIVKLYLVKSSINIENYLWSIPPPPPPHTQKNFTSEPERH